MANDSRALTIILSILTLLIIITPVELGSTVPVSEGSEDGPIILPPETAHLVDGSLDYLAAHPEEMEELGATPAPSGSINVLLQLDSLDDTDHGYVEALGGTVTDSWSRFDTLAATVPLDSLSSLSFIPGLVWLEPSLKVYPMLASSVPAIGGDSVWSDLGYDGAGTTIAVLDTGINGNHEYLDDLDDDPETEDPKIIGFYDARAGSRGEREPVDSANHGSHCAGIAAGTGGTAGVDIGMAPQANLVGVIVLDGGGGTANDIIDGINWVVTNKDRFSVDVMSLSLGGPITIPGATNDGNSAVSQALDDAVEDGIVTTVAVGNGNAGVAAHAGSVTYPADSRRSITVGWVNDNGNRAISSSRGPTGDGRMKPDVMAPGSSVNSAKGQAGDTGSQSMSGSSMSTPHVAGLAALMLQANPDLVPDEDHDDIKQILHETSRHEWGDSPDPFEPYSPNNQYGWGTVDSPGAVQRALDLRSGEVTGEEELPLEDSSTYQFSIDYSKTQYTFQGEDGNSHNPPTGSSAPDLTYLEVRLSNDWPEPTDIVGNARAFSGLEATVEPATLEAKNVGGEWVIQAWMNYTGDGDSGEYWDSYPLISFTLTAPDEQDSTTLTGSYSINNMPGEDSTLQIDSTGESPDLVVSSFRSSDDSPEEGDVVTLTAVVKNNGEGTARNGDLTMYDGDPDGSGVELSSRSFSDLESGKSMEIFYDWDTNGQAGDHTMYARVSDVSPAETNSDNNDATPIDIEVQEEVVVNTPPTITVLEPDRKGEVADEEYTIEWHADDEDGDSLSIDLYYDTDTNSGNGRILIQRDLENSAVYEWDTSEVNEGEYYIYGIADDGEGETDDDYSGGTVEIIHGEENTPPEMEVLEPNGDDDVADEEYTITWSAQDADDDTLSIDLYYDTDTNSGNGRTLIHRGLENTGEYDWDTSEQSEGEYYVYGVANDGKGGTADDYSEGTVLVDHEEENTPPEMEVLEPNGDDDVADEEYTITWSAQDADDDTLSIDLHYDTDTNPDNGRTLIDSGLSNSGSYSWDTSELDEGEYYIYGTADDGRGGRTSDYSEGMVEIDHDEPPVNHAPDIEILEPAGNDDEADEEYTITWAASDEDDDLLSIDLYYDTDQSPDNGKTLIESALQDTGSYDWDTSGVEEDDYFIYAVVDDGEGATDDAYSPGFLRIDHYEPPVNEDPTVEVSSVDPVDEETLEVWWNASDDDGDSLKVSLYYDTDTNPNNGKTLIEDRLDAVGSYQWDISDMDEDDYQIYALADDGRGGEGSHYSEEFEISFPEEFPDFMVLSLEITPEAPAAGDTVSITLTAKNLGSLAGSGSVRILVDGDEVKLRSLSLEVGQEETLEVEWTAVEGAHTISVELGLVDDSDLTNNGKTVSISVSASTQLPQDPAEKDDDEFPYHYLGLGIAVVAALGIVGVLLYRKEADEAEEEEEDYGVWCSQCGEATVYSVEEDDHYCEECEEYLGEMGDME